MRHRSPAARGSWTEAPGPTLSSLLWRSPLAGASSCWLRGASSCWLAGASLLQANVNEFAKCYRNVNELHSAAGSTAFGARTADSGRTHEAKMHNRARTMHSGRTHEAKIQTHECARTCGTVAGCAGPRVGGARGRCKLGLWASAAILGCSCSCSDLGCRSTISFLHIVCGHPSCISLVRHSIVAIALF